MVKVLVVVGMLMLLGAALKLVGGGDGDHEKTLAERIDESPRTPKPTPADLQAASDLRRFEPSSYKAASVLGHSEAEVTTAIGVQPVDEGPGKKRYNLDRDRHIVITIRKGIAVRLAVQHPEAEDVTIPELLAWLSVTDADAGHSFKIDGRSYEARRPQPRETSFTEVSFAAVDRKAETKLREAADRMATKAAAKYEIDRRRDWASALGQKFLDSGIEASASTSGKDAKTLRIKSFMCSLVFLNEFEKGVVGREFDGMGFTCLRCNDGIVGDYTLGCGR
jgi:hypothetical protein